MQREDLIPAEDFCLHHRLEASFIQQLEEYGLVRTTRVEEVHYLPADTLPDVEKLARLHYNLHINFEGLYAVSHLLNEAEVLQQELVRLRNRLRLYEGE